MGLAALGCDPTAKGDSLADIGGHSPGTLAYSPDGGIYMAIRANGAVSQYAACLISGAGQDATPLTATNHKTGALVAIPQVSLADDEYGWGLVAGKGRVDTDGSVALDDTFIASGTGGELDTAGAGATASLVAGIYATAADGADDGPIYCLWPHCIG